MIPRSSNLVLVRRLAEGGKAQLAFAALMNGVTFLMMAIGAAVMPERVGAIALAVCMSTVVSLLVMAEVAGTFTRIHRNV